MWGFCTQMSTWPREQNDSRGIVFAGTGLRGGTQGAYAFFPSNSVLAYNFLFLLLWAYLETQDL